MASHADLLALKKTMSARYLTKATTEAVTTFAAAASVNPAQNVVGVGPRARLRAAVACRARRRA